MGSLKNNDPFWTSDFEILYKSERLAEFIPTSEMSTTERLNAIARFGLYSGILLTLTKNKTWPIYMSIFTMLFTVFVYQNSEMLSENLEGFGIMDTLGSVIGTQSIDLIKEKRIQDIGPDQPTQINEEGEECTAPTANNPFMNVLATEFGESKPPACDTEYDADIQKDIDEKFNLGLYKDVSDLYGKNNSQRNFYTNPNTSDIPDIDGTFKNWLYGNMSSCKDDRYDCQPDNEDLRSNPFMFPDSEQTPSSF